MEIQKLLFSNSTVTPPTLSFSHISPSVYRRTNASINRYCVSGLSNPIKRVSKSLTTSRRYGGVVGVRCEVLQDANLDDGFYMRRCVELARKAIGRTSPNPMVGSVVVRDGKIVGEGFHPKAGQPHGEVFALRDAGDLAENATVYVSLEPCNHYGRTPPCTEALIKAKVKRVVIGMVDPNPIVASMGVQKLRNAGIEVTVGVEEDLCKRLNEAYIHQMLTGKPFVTLRYSLSLNGCFSEHLGEGAADAGGYYSQMLQEYDAVIHSASIINKSSIPQSQEPGANQPLQLLVACSRDSPICLPSTTETASKLIIFSDKETATEPKVAQNGIENVVMDQISMTAILEYCQRQGLCSVLIDLRGSLGDLDGILRDAIEEKVLQKVVAEVLPVWDERHDGSTNVALNSKVKKLEVKNLRSMMSGQSIVLEGHL